MPVSLRDRQLKLYRSAGITLRPVDMANQLKLFQHVPAEAKSYSRLPERELPAPESNGEAIQGELEKAVLWAGISSRLADSVTMSRFSKIQLGPTPSDIIKTAIFSVFNSYPGDVKDNIEYAVLHDAAVGSLADVDRRKEDFGDLVDWYRVGVVRWRDQSQSPIAVVNWIVNPDPRDTFLLWRQMYDIDNPPAPLLILVNPTDRIPLCFLYPDRESKDLKAAIRDVLTLREADGEFPFNLR
ncbi:hypothetical protein EMPG_15099 [Blastomyces silverae]|uniref:Uncharacterized protein n=1 Tax=Blastomyces silverae TaxID=2060906 RepID=A0A0H1BEC7_9EURO|nr:hypothetical protein EMPG_15099 [Blastomyces silverae]